MILQREIRKDSLWIFRGYGSCNVTKRLDGRLTRARTYGREGSWRGTLSTNPLNPDSVSNPRGCYGSSLPPDSLNSPLGAGSSMNPGR